MGIQLVTLLIDDYDRALRFFTNALDFDVVDDSPAMTNDGRPKRWVIVRARDGGCALLLARADGSQQEQAMGRQVGGRVGFFLHVADLPGALDRALRHGAQLQRPPRDEPYGRVAVISDPWGNLWDLLQPS